MKIDIPSVSKGGTPILTVPFPFILFGMALLEEFIFRFPLAIFIKNGWAINKILLIGLALSALFGFLHGSIYNIFIQGVVGFIYCILFLKSGALNGKYTKALMTTAITHFSFNLIVVGIALALGATRF